MEEQPQSVAPMEVVRVLSALSDVNRYRIVGLLACGAAELTCGAICSSLQLSPSLVSHHLSVLEDAGLIHRRKDGLWTLNSLRRDELARRLSGLQQMVAPPGPTINMGADGSVTIGLAQA